MKTTEREVALHYLLNQTNESYGDMVSQLAGAVNGLANLLTYEQLSTDEFDYLLETVSILNSIQIKNSQLMRAIDTQIEE